MTEEALAAALRARDARLVDVEGRPVAVHFGDAEAEYRALREGAGVVDAWWRGRMLVTGSDRVDFLQGMLSNDVKRLVAGTGCPTLLLSEQGRVVADLVALAMPEAFALDGVGAGVEAARIALERYVVADDVEFAAPEPAEHTFMLLGPAASAVLERLGLPAPSEPFAHATVGEGGAAVQVVRVQTPGGDAFHVHVAVAAAAEWWLRCLDAGAAAAVGSEAYDAARIEDGVPWFGRDVQSDTLALEAPYDSLISFRKGCYLGQEVMERVTARGHVNRKLVGLALAGAVVPASGARVYAGEREVGWVTSAAWSWRFAAPLALAYVRREHLTPGTTLTVGDDPGIPATVRALPF